MTETQQLVTFSLDDYHFGIDVQAVQEIIRTRTLTDVPLADRSIRGLLNLRGQIVTVIDLKRRLDFPQMKHLEHEGDAMNVVVRAEAGPVSFQVDAVGDVIDADPAAFEPPPRSARQAGKEFVTGVYKLDGRLLHVLSVEKVVDFSSRAARTAIVPEE